MDHLHKSIHLFRSRRTASLIALLVALNVVGGVALIVVLTRRAVPRPTTSLSSEDEALVAHNDGLFLPDDDEPVLPELTPFETFDTLELRALVASGKIADCSHPAVVAADVELPRIPAWIFTEEDPRRYFAVFSFAGTERRVESLSGQVSVLTDGTHCAVVDEEQCGTPVRIIKLDRDGIVLFEVEVYQHAHSRACFARRRGLVFVYIFQDYEEFDCSSIRVWDWETGRQRFVIRMPSMDQPFMAVTQDERFLMVCDRKGRVRQYDIDMLDQDNKEDREVPET